LLRKTQADNAVGAYRQLIFQYPTLKALANADRYKIERTIAILGLGRQRGRDMIAAARTLSAAEPSPAYGNEDIPGIGEYGSAFLTVVMNGEAAGPVDGNIARIISRFRGYERIRGELRKDH
jgi:A/G-specific adenine glycosylase